MKEDKNCLKIEASLDRARASLGETVQLKLRLTNACSSALRLPKAFGAFSDFCSLVPEKDAPAGALAVRAMPTLHFVSDAHFQNLEPGRTLELSFDVRNEFSAPGSFRFRVRYHGNGDYRPLVLSEPPAYAGAPADSNILALDVEDKKRG